MVCTPLNDILLVGMVLYQGEGLPGNLVARQCLKLQSQGWVGKEGAGWKMAGGI